MNIEDIIAERTIYAIDKDGNGLDLRLMIGRPYKTDTKFGDWACPVAIEGLHDTFWDMYGTDSWQALMIAHGLMGRLLTYFIEEGGKLYWKQGGAELDIATLFGAPYLEPDTPDAIAAEPEDGTMSEEQLTRVSKLTDDEIAQIDTSIMNHCTHQFRKLARIIFKAMDETEGSRHDIPDLFYAERIRSLVRNGQLESQGDLNKMRFSEVRRISS